MAVIPMPDPRSRPGLEPGLDAGPPSNPETETTAKIRKKKDKVRAAWISFAGRIVAQVVGAMVTVALTLFVVQKVQQSTAEGHKQFVPSGESVVPDLSTRIPRRRVGSGFAARSNDLG
jgi:hypothetical protein